ncbi:MAG: hypothetical protein KJO01_03840 [Gammaproteobacteria bacterium]|nr:hypothetical protein [Gammaproteobacteria bacterium]NND47473.1 hypothetical protein [Woeseiaceae bacterium]
MGFRSLFDRRSRAAACRQGVREASELNPTLSATMLKIQSFAGVGDIEVRNNVLDGGLPGHNNLVTSDNIINAGFAALYNPEGRLSRTALTLIVCFGSQFCRKALQILSCLKIARDYPLDIAWFVIPARILLNLC